MSNVGEPPAGASTFRPQSLSIGLYLHVSYFPSRHDRAACIDDAFDNDDKMFPMPLYYGIAEPRGSVRPNVRDKDVNGLKRDVLVDLMVGLPCPVQGFPAPTFRYAVRDRRIARGGN